MTCGCWNSIAMRLPRIAFSSGSDFASMSSSPSRIAPPVTSKPRGRSRISESAVRLLPHPDSPTSASTSPAAISSDTSSMNVPSAL